MFSYYDECGNDEYQDALNYTALAYLKCNDCHERKWIRISNLKLKYVIFLKLTN